MRDQHNPHRSETAAVLSALTEANAPTDANAPVSPREFATNQALPQSASAPASEKKRPRFGSTSRTGDPRRDNGASIVDLQVKNVFAPYTPATRKPAGPPTRDRKLKHLSQEQVNAARALVKPQPPLKPGKIVFEPDDTPANAEEILRTASTRPVAKVRPVPPVRHGPLPASAPPSQRETREQIRAARNQITPFQPVPSDTENTANTASSAVDSPELTDPELAQIIQLVQQKYGPILSIDQAAEISKLAKQTLRERVCQGRYASSVVRGRPLRFWAHRFVKEAMRP